MLPHPLPRRLLLPVPIVCLLLASACGPHTRGTDGEQRTSRLQEAWNEANDPASMGVNYELAFDALPLQGDIGSRPWSDSYWPSDHGGLAWRWQDPGIKEKADNFEYASPSREALESMSRQEVNRLSPAEKYDVFLGRYDYPLQTLERSRTSPRDEFWEGLCHGWAAAAMNFLEPGPVVLVNPNGIEVPFASSDIKSLLTYAQIRAGGSTRFLGQRCNANLEESPGNGTDVNCRDTNAGSFHAVLANEIGLRRKAFIMDVTRDQQVWNHPVHTYRSRVLGARGPGSGASDRAAREFVVETEVWFTVEVKPAWNGFGPNGQVSRKEVYRYSLELDDAGNIRGGEWLDSAGERTYGTGRPDFLWAQEPARFTGYFSKVADIYRAAVKPRNTAR